MSQAPTHSPDPLSVPWRGRAIQGASFCAIVPGAADGGGTTAHFLPLAIVLAAFVAAGTWMFRRWGREEPAQAPERLPEAAPRASTLQPEAGA